MASAVLSLIAPFPAGERRTVGLVSTGFSAGAVVAPVLLGWVVDLGQPALVFWAVAGFTLLGVFTLVGVSAARSRLEPAPAR